MSMNKSFRKLLMVSSVLVLACTAAPAQSRIATVELTQVFEKFWKTKQARLALNDTRTDLKKELEDLQEAQKKLVQQYQKQVSEANDQAVSSEEREKRKKGLEGKLKELKEGDDNLKAFVSRGDAELERKTQRMMDDVVKDIRAAVAAKAKSAGYAFVFDSSADSMAKAKVMLYNSGESDLTEEVIKDLNITAPADLPNASEKTTDKKEKK